jgi:hypothetical protein
LVGAAGFEPAPPSPQTDGRTRVAQLRLNVEGQQYLVPIEQKSKQKVRTFSCWVRHFTGRDSNRLVGFFGLLA